VRVKATTAAKLKLAGLGLIAGLLLIGGGYFSAVATRGRENSREARVSAHVESVAYENQLSACEGRGNEQRRWTYEIAGLLAKLHRQEIAQPALRIADEMSAAPYALANGETACLEALVKP
jgi:hypothetical protein